jgi:hypothetical protein
MFEVKEHKCIPKDMHRIVSNHQILFNDGENDIIYTGTNKFGNIILGVIIFDDDDNNYLRYLHVILDDYQYLNFFTKKITLKEILETNGSFFVVDKKYNKEEIKYNIISFDELPEEFKPSDKSYCPDILYKPSLEYSFSLQGGLSDYHIATTEELNSINTKFDNLLKKSSEFVNQFELGRTVFIEAGDNYQYGMVGSFKIKFKIELKQPEQLSILHTPSLDKITEYLNRYFSYVFQKLPEESDDIFQKETVKSTEFKEIETLLTDIYYEGDATVPEAGLEQQLIDNISTSVQNLKEIDYSKGFSRISFINYSKKGEEFPLGIIDKEFVPKIEKKFFKPEVAKKEDDIEKDYFPKKYKIHVYLFNTITGVGSASIKLKDSLPRVSLFVTGRKDFSKTIFTHSLDKNKIVTVNGYATKINGKFDRIDIEL